MPEALRCGVYEHYKGGRYLVLGVARHSETGEMLVVYVPLYRVDGPAMSVRPLEMFTESLPDGRPRFRYAGDEEAP